MGGREGGSDGGEGVQDGWGGRVVEHCWHCVGWGRGLCKIGKGGGGRFEVRLNGEVLRMVGRAVVVLVLYGEATVSVCRPGC